MRGRGNEVPGFVFLQRVFCIKMRSQGFGQNFF